jgi:hypothetical protein
LNERSGVLSTLRSLDAERQQQYQVVVATREASMSIFPLSDINAAVVTVRVRDRNDYIPTFDSLTYAITVADYTQPGTAVFEVKAVDQDVTSPNNVVAYRLTGVDGADQYFRIDRNTGMLSVARQLTDVAGRSLTVSAHVGARVHTCTVIRRSDRRWSADANRLGYHQCIGERTRQSNRWHHSAWLRHAAATTDSVYNAPVHVRYSYLVFYPYVQSIGVGDRGATVHNPCATGA